MAFCAPPSIPALDPMIFVHIYTTITPRASPRPVIYIIAVPAPVEAAVAPAPGAKEGANRYSISKANRPANEEARPRPGINHQRIVVRHRNELWVRGRDLDVGTAAHNNLAIASQIAKVPGPLPHSLHRVHHILALGEKCIAKIRCPVHIRSHHV